MASLRNRHGKWQVQIRRRGHPPLNKTFTLYKDAIRWARRMESQLERGTLKPDYPKLKQYTLGDVLLRYQSHVTPHKKGATSEHYRITNMLCYPMASCPLHTLHSHVIAEYRDTRLTVVKPSSVHRELGILRHSLDLAITEWGFALSTNPVTHIRFPKVSPPRERRLHPGELERLIQATQKGRVVWLRPLLLLAVETALRRGELLSLSWSNIDVRAQTAKVCDTKNGTNRTIPLTPKAIEILKSLPSEQEYVFAVSGNAVRLAWKRLTRRARITDLRFHDLRHEAISRFFEKGLNVPEVALISGHKDPRMLFRYTHLRAKDITRKLGSYSELEPT